LQWHKSTCSGSPAAIARSDPQWHSAVLHQLSSPMTRGWRGYDPLLYSFVDVGVHQDGLVHISAMANAYVKDPRKIAKPGDVVHVKVLEIDPQRRRISLTMRLDQVPEARPTTGRAEIARTESDKRLRPAETRAGRSNSVPASGDAMAEAFRRAGLTGKTSGRQ
jgi:hypothetical protein